MRKIFDNWPILIVILLIVSTRILSFNKDGVDFWADERHFHQLMLKLDESFEQKNYGIAFNTIFHLNARPGLGLFYLPSAFLQWKYPGIPFGAYYNLLVNIGILILIFLTVKKLFDKKSALFASLLIILSLSTVIYLRHLLPYDTSLFLLLLGIYIYLVSNKAFIFGLASGLSFITYATYYYLAPIPLILLLAHKSLKPVLMFVLGIALVFVLTEGAYKFFDKSSYFYSLKAESAGVTSVQIGDYVPAASFIFQYILAMDGIWNFFLIILGVFLFIMQKKDKKLVLVSIYLLTSFFIMEFTSHIIRTHVLYGRTVRPLYLGLLIFTSVLIVKFVSKLSKGKGEVFAVYFFIIILISILNWLPNFAMFKNLMYPSQFKQLARDYVKEKYGDKANVEELLFVNYFGIGEPHTRMKIFKEYKNAASDTYYIVNANVIYPYFGSYDIKYYCNAQILLQELHVQSKFKPYLFEGWKEVMRELATKEPLYYQLVYCK